jgi:hypothetical protein
MKTVIRPVTLISLSLTLLLVFSLAAEARKQRYRPNRPGRYTGNTTTTGTRGSCEDSRTPLSLTAIAPLNHIGQTASAKPTLTWYVPDQKSHNMELRLLQSENDDTQLRQVVWQSPERFPSQAGFMQQTLPETIKLSPEKVYIWQVTLFCNPKRPSQDQVVEAPIQFVQPSGTAPNTANSPWYDLLQEANGNVTNISGLIQDLLEVEVATQTNSPQVKEHHDRLQQVLTTLQPVANQNKR